MGLEWFGDEIDGANLKCVEFVVDFVECTDKDDWNFAQVFLLLDAASGFVTVDTRHAYIQQDQVRPYGGNGA